jgi:hypothetical protein
MGWAADVGSVLGEAVGDVLTPRRRCAMATRPVTVNDVVAGHVALDLESFDRLYLNRYVPNLQVGGQVVNFLTSRGFPIPSPALLERNDDRFRRAVEGYAESCEPSL